MSKKNQAKVIRLWKQGLNVWEISKLTGIDESQALILVRTL